MNVKFIKAIDEDAAEISQILEDWAASNREIPLVHNVEERADYGCWLLEHTSVTMIHNSCGVVGFLALEKHIIQGLYIKKDFQGFGFGQFQPIDLGTSLKSLARNRRIELKLTEK